MPLPMVHFAVAVEVAKRQSKHLTSAFLLGSIAPDAIHVRAGTDRSDKNRTHLLQAPHAATEDAHYLATVGDFVQRRSNAEPEVLELVAGYAAHLLTDRLWVQTVYHDFCQQAPGALTVAERTQLYYQETEQVDRKLYKQMPWRQTVWALLERARPMAVEPLLTADEVWRYKGEKQAWYSTETTYRQQPQYITYERVTAFIPQVSAWVAALLGQW
jgi:hypothetical protein